jgi:hypothetical protein
MLNTLTNNRIFYAVATSSFKAALTLGTTVSGVLGVILGEIFTGQWGTAGLAGAVAATVGAFFVFIPRFMEQRRKNVVSYSEVRDKEQTALLARMADLNAREIAFYKLQVAEAIYVASLERQAKHDLLGELTASQSHNQILITQIRKLGAEPVIELHPIDYTKITKPVDEEIQRLRKQAVEVAKDALPKVNAEADALRTELRS